MGPSAYNKATGLIYGPDYKWFKNLEDQIQDRYVGPDCYWKDPTEQPIPGSSKFFGNGWWIPFPPTLVRPFSFVGYFVDLSLDQVIRYDDGPLKVLRNISDLKSYIIQNSSPDVERKRQIRMALRALDGQRVTWPYDHLQVTSEMMPPSMS